MNVRLTNVLGGGRDFEFECACYRDSNGIAVQCYFHELADEFNAEIPDWEKRLSEHDGRENGTLISVTEIDTINPLHTEAAIIAAWDIFIEMEKETY